MSLEWETFELNDICILNKSSYSKKDDWKFINYLDTKNIIKGKINEIKYLNPNEDAIPSRAKRKVENKDIIYSTVRPNQEHYGLIENPPENFLVSTGFTTITVDTKNAIPEFVYYFITQNHITESLQTIAEQSTTSYPSIRPSNIGDLIISLPNLHNQKKISSILRNIEQKIKVNGELNNNLEKIGQTILNENFFIFSKYSDDLLIDTEIGKIPINWRTYKLKELFNHIKPGTNYQPNRVEEGIPFLNVKNINSGFIDLSDVKYISVEDFKKVHKTWVPEENDILISRIGTLGLVTVINKEDLPLAVHYNFINVKSDKLPHQFVYFLFKSNNFQRKYQTIKKYSVQEYVTIDDFSEIEIASPNDLDELKSVFDLFVNLFDNIQKNILEIKKLQKLRDTLLPKLMSGEIDVSQINCDLNLIIKKIILKFINPILWRILI
ncbi:restriction endonuclease subunit S [uncultured Methanobrevibacter sp.]|uniref:restriction endonuclease subunit S n=1 Tax=uncultured Methanobrevibacter sp. TaxID=253161 RepID=UPI0025EEC6FF|nr:restriction endonuclease subunit S [uncultured Methanobrevibacter sp.]